MSDLGGFAASGARGSVPLGAATPPNPPSQVSFADLGTPLYETTFVVLDIETTGGSPSADAITEVGAIKCEGGVVTGTFQTLVRPEEAITGFVELLTGITNNMVAEAPPIEEVLPSLWEFLRGTVLVAHNARFDASFLAAAFARHGYTVPFRRTVCTLRLARWLMKGETRDMKLETLSRMIGTASIPCHRAFPDAQATFEIFHRLLEMAGPHGVLTLEDLIAFTRARSRSDPGKIALAARVPRVAGVYKFLDKQGAVLYVGKSKNMRARVRSYFHGDSRTKVSGLLQLAAKIDWERCETEIAAQVRELVLIRQHNPPFNRQGKKRSGPVWIAEELTPEPRLKIVRSAPDSPLLGPFRSQKAGREVTEALMRDGPPWDIQGALSRLTDRMGLYARTEHFEQAAATRDMIEAVLAASQRAELIRTFIQLGDLLVFVPSGDMCEVTAIRQGRLVDSGMHPASSIPNPKWLFVDAPEHRDRTWVTHEELEEMLLLDSYIRRTGALGGWVQAATGRLLPLVSREPLRK